MYICWLFTIFIADFCTFHLLLHFSISLLPHCVLYAVIARSTNRCLVSTKNKLEIVVESDDGRLQRLPVPCVKRTEVASATKMLAKVSLPCSQGSSAACEAFDTYSPQFAPCLLGWLTVFLPSVEAVVETTVVTYSTPNQNVQQKRVVFK